MSPAHPFLCSAPVAPVDRDVFVTEITRPISSLLSTTHTEVYDNLEIFFFQDFLRASFIDGRFWLAVGQ